MNNEQFKAFKELVQEANEGVKIENLIRHMVGGSYKFETEGNILNVAPNPLKPGGDHNDQSFRIFTSTNSYCNYQDSSKGKRKDCITFLREYNNWSFNETGRYLIEFAGISHRLALIMDPKYKHTNSIKRELPSIITSSNTEKKHKDYSKLINDAAKNIEQADYLIKERCLSIDILKKYKVGYVPNGLGENQKYKYVFPIDNDYVIVRSNTKEKKRRYQNWGNSKPFNLRYMNDPSLTDKYIFVTEGYIDVLSIEMLGYKAISINSTSNADIFINYIKENKKNFKDKVLIIAGDADCAGKTMNTKITNQLNALNIQFDTYIIPRKGDFNDWLVANKAEFSKNLRNYISTLENKILNIKPNEVEFGSSVFEKDNCYFKNGKEGSKVISNFIIEPIELIESTKISELNALLYANSGIKVHRHFTMEDFNSTTKFKKSLNSIDLSYTGRDDDLEYIKAKISRKQFKRKEGVLSIGFHYINGKWIFVTGNKTIGEDLNEVKNIVMLESYKELDTDLLEYSPITQEELLGITKALFKFNDLKKVSTVLGYVASLFLKEKLWYAGIKFNHLLIIGEAGSGKSQTLENVITPLLGLKTSPLGAAKCTPFSTMKTASSSNTIPLVIEEYKPGQIGSQRVKDISNLLRDVYDHHRGQRGKSNQTIEYYDLCSPVILVGEMGTNETAIKERSLQVIFSKLDIEASDRKAYFETLKGNQDILKKLGRSLLDTSFKINEVNIKELHSACLNKVSTSITVPRIKDSIANCIIGIELLEQVYKDLGLNIENITGFKNKDIVEAINSTAFEDLLDSNNNSKTVVDITLETFARMADADKLIEDIDYAKVNGWELALYINRLYDKYNKYKSECKLDDEYLTQNQFTSQLRRTNYFLKYKPVKLYVNFSKECKKPYKCYVLDINKLRKKSLDLEPLIGCEDDIGGIDGLTECLNDDGIPFN